MSLMVASMRPYKVTVSAGVTWNVKPGSQSALATIFASQLLGSAVCGVAGCATTAGCEVTASSFFSIASRRSRCSSSCARCAAISAFRSLVASANAGAAENAIAAIAPATAA